MKERYKKDEREYRRKYKKYFGIQKEIKGN
jgi:hypothetical protein